MDKYPRGGVILSDGGVVWIVDDIRDGMLVGGVRLDYVLRVGSVKANGALLQRSSYPRLFDWVERNKSTISTTESDWQKDFNRYQFTLGDGSTTFRVPDLRGKWFQAAESIGLLAAGLPNIRGAYNSHLHKSGVQPLYNGACACVSYQVSNYPAHTDGIAPGVQFDFSAQRSNPIYGNSDTVQPPSVKLIAQIRY